MSKYEKAKLGTVSGKNTILRLRTGEKFELKLADWPNALFWFPSSEVRLEKKEDGYYNYRIVNLENNQTIEARLLSRHML